VLSEKTQQSRNEMNRKKLTDGEAKQVLLSWPTRTTLWPPPLGRGHWLRGQPRDLDESGPRISSPGATLFTTQPDALWAHFNATISCDIVAVEVCGTIQNLNDKRSRYIPATHSLVLSCSDGWFHEAISIQKGGPLPRWKAAGTFPKKPVGNPAVPIRHLRVLYAIPNALYHLWCHQHTPTGYEFFCPHSSLHTYNSQQMQEFLRRMSSAAQFRVKVNRSET
jgi:hypothetical protein